MRLLPLGSLVLSGGALPALGFLNAQPGFRCIDRRWVMRAEQTSNTPDRRSAILTAVGTFALFPTFAQALVKGNAPPSDLRKKPVGDRPKVQNIDEARELGAKKEDELFAQVDGGAASSFSKTSEGDRYRDMVVGTGEQIEKGSTTNIRYRALRLGKRSRDGLSGEASVVFSYGYGEDDDKDGDSIEITVGTSNLIPALESAIVGMKSGGRRRILVRPERGWVKDTTCGGALDDLNVNSLAANFIVPGTKITEAEDCLDTSRIPSPVSYAAKRRMGRRFDESLIVEVEVVPKPEK